MVNISNNYLSLNNFGLKDPIKISINNGIEFDTPTISSIANFAKNSSLSVLFLMLKKANCLSSGIIGTKKIKALIAKKAIIANFTFSQFGLIS